MSETAHHGDQTADPLDGQRELTVDEVTEIYRDEWILMKVSAFDERNFPWKGCILAHSPRRGDITAALSKEPPRTKRPPDARNQLYYVFRAFPRIRSGPEYERGMGELFAQLVQAGGALRARRHR